MIHKSLFSSLKSVLSTINKQQMQQFDKIKSWWHPSSEMNVLFQYNYQRIQFLHDILKNSQQHAFGIRKPLANFKIIDVGCGAGFLSQSLTRLGGKVVGLDPNQTSFNEATTHKSEQSSLSNLTYFNCSIQQYLQQNTQEKESQDIVTSMDVIEHVDNPELFLAALISSLKPGGLIMLSTISKSLYSFLTHIVFAQYVTGLVPRGTHNYQKFLTPQTLCKMLENAGVQIVGLRELQYTWRGQFQQSRGGANYMVIGRKRQLKNQQNNQKKQLLQ